MKNKVVKVSDKIVTAENHFKPFCYQCYTRKKVVK